MSDPRQSFLSAILESPGDDTPRLICADWLEEHGGEPERAEFIRVQCELAPWAAKNSTFEPMHLPALRRREQELWLASRHVWGNLPGPLGDATNEFSWWRRGFVGKVSCTLRDWMNNGPASVRAAPLEEVEIRDREPLARSIGRRAHFCWRLEDLTPGCFLPVRIAERLPQNHFGPALTAARYPTLQEALSDLSKACLAWARSKKNAAEAAAT